MATALFGPTLKTHSGDVPTAEALSGAKVVGIYFSAHWCPPCRGFTPMLAEFYNSAKQAHPGAMQIVFVSSDRDEHSYNEYFGSMPWVAVPLSDGATKQRLAEKYGVRGIPTLVVVNAATGATVDASARNTVSEGDIDAALEKWQAV
jgi:nucleoredoxin